MSGFGLAIHSLTLQSAVSQGSFLFVIGCSSIPNHACDSCPGPAAVSASSYSALAVTASATYSNGLSCSVTVGAVNGGVPALNFTSFSTELGYDFVGLFDGNSTSAPLLGRYSGTQLVDHLIVGTSGTRGMLTLQISATRVVRKSLLSHGGRLRCGVDERRVK